MFPHSITIYKHSIIDGEDVYFMQCVDGFYWQEKTNINNKDKGYEKDCFIDNRHLPNIRDIRAENEFLFRR